MDSRFAMVRGTVKSKFAGERSQPPSPVHAINQCTKPVCTVPAEN